MKTIAFMNEKGGVGKTTLAANIGADLARRGYRVVLIDTDPQGHLAFRFGMPKEAAFHDFILRGATWRDSLRVVDPARWAMPGHDMPSPRLFLMPGNAETRAIPLSISDPMALTARLEELRSANQVDFVLIDTAPTPSLLHTLIYLSSDGVVVPVHTAAAALDGLAATIARQQKAKTTSHIELLGIVPLAFRKGTLEHTLNLATLKERYGSVVWQPIPQRVLWQEAEGYGVAVYNSDPGSEAAADLYSMTDALLDQVGMAYEKAS